MKLFQRFLLSIAFAALAAMMSAGISLAQIPNPTPVWAAYAASITNQFFNPLVVLPPPFGGVISNGSFLSFAGTYDPDDGVAVDIPAGFSFDYNGTSYSTVNVCINGWLSIGHAEAVPVPTITNDKYFLFLPNRP